MLELALLSRGELEEKVLELESVLTEFQESSRELELALEDELANLEGKVSALEFKGALLDSQAAKDRLSAQSLTQELETLYDRHNKKSTEWDNSRKRIMQQLVLVEIANDTMENNDRAQQTQLTASQQLVNELLEKLAIVEHDLELERANSASNKLYIANYRNEVRELTEKLSAMEKLTRFNQKFLQSESCEGDVLVVSMRQVLLDGPPTPQVFTRSYPRLPSLQKLHELHRGVSLYMTRSGLSSSEPSSSSSPQAVALTRPSPFNPLLSSATGSRESQVDTSPSTSMTATPLSAPLQCTPNDRAMHKPQFELLVPKLKHDKKRMKGRLLELPPFRVPGRRSGSDA